jgi:hypothetical protein
MPLDPDRLRLLTEQAGTLSKRVDALIERCKADDDDDDDDDDEEEDDLLEPAEQALRLTPGSDLPNPDIEEPWYE